MASSSTFVIPSIFTWSQAPAERDVEAQLVVGTYEQYHDHRLPTPLSAVTHTSRVGVPPMDEGSDPVDDFFGVVRSSRPLRGNQDSRHDSVSLPAHCDDVPPPYSNAAGPPAYSRVAEQPTLAMYLFKFGFLFPLFWIAGALILISPLHAPEDWGMTKTQAEMQELIGSMRRTEVKWAKRCLVALTALVLVVMVVVLATVLSRKS